MLIFGLFHKKLLFSQKTTKFIIQRYTNQFWFPSYYENNSCFHFQSSYIQCWVL